LKKFEKMPVQYRFVHSDGTMVLADMNEVNLAHQLNSGGGGALRLLVVSTTDHLPTFSEIMSHFELQSVIFE
jgi:hypothetical protein